ncbi:hypothetical protein KSP40_PGU005829 [Platanthera guangdongensis]|uniref:Uncharacterized protein n=1 Tax=Platanthera guangdongensis TaxID=2320717 RepID=A0ABR2MS58_9ASPA
MKQALACIFGVASALRSRTRPPLWSGECLNSRLPRAGVARRSAPAWGYLWKQTNSKKKPIPQDSSPLVMMPQGVSLEKRGHGIVTGSILSATDKLREAIPFDKSTILITMAEGQQAFQGIIINKPLRWSTIFDDLVKDLEPIKEAPLFYGGPVRAAGLPLVSLARNPTAGYTKVIPGAYFGNPTITRMTIEGIKSGDRSANEYWFFLGYCSWNGDQIFDELAQGAWHLSDGSIGRLNWPEST